MHASSSEAVTNNVRVEVESQYAADHSQPFESHWFFHYTVKITNEGDDTVQLLSRQWFITDATGHTEEVSGPGVDPQCFAPRDASVKFLKYPAKTAPFKIALVNGYVGNTWRIQMVQTAKAYVESPDVKPDIAEFKVVSVGEDVPAQIAAIDQFINAGFDAIVMIANNSTSYGPVLERAAAANVVVVPFDVVVNSDKVITVNESQTDIGRLAGEYVAKHIPGRTGKILEVRGIPGTSTDQYRHDGFRKAMDAVGKW